MISCREVASVFLFPGADELVRTVKVRAKGETLKQPVTKLCLLEGVNDE